MRGSMGRASQGVAEFAALRYDGGQRRAMRAALSRGAAVRGGRQRNGKLVVARRSTLNTEALVKLGAERLAELALDEAERNGPFKKLVMAALASERGPEAVAAIVDKRLAGLETARGTIGWGKAKSFGEDLSATLKIITGDLAKADAEAAADRLMRFLATADRTLSRDGSSGDGTAAVYYAAAAALPGLIAKLPPEASLMAADRLYDLTAESRYGVAENSASEILAAAPPVLVEAFDQRLAEGLRALGPFAADDSDWSRHARARRLIELRQRVADARGDVDAFIELETGLPGHFPDPAEIAERLTAAGRHREALDWLRRPSRPSVKRLRMEDLNAGLAPRDPAVDRRQRVEIRVLEALGKRARCAGSCSRKRWTPTAYASISRVCPISKMWTRSTPPLRWRSKRRSSTPRCASSCNGPGSIWPSALWSSGAPSGTGAAMKSSLPRPKRSNPPNRSRRPSSIARWLARSWKEPSRPPTLTPRAITWNWRALRRARTRAGQLSGRKPGSRRFAADTAASMGSGPQWKRQVGSGRKSSALAWITAPLKAALARRLQLGHQRRHRLGPDVQRA